MSSPGFFSALKAIFLGPSISQAQREAAKATVEVRRSQRRSESTWRGLPTRKDRGKGS